MKKILLGTTALVAATALTTGVAQAEIAISGFAYSGVHGATSADDGASDTSGIRGYHNSGLSFSASTEMDSGMTVSWSSDLYIAGNAATNTTDSNAFSLSDDWGSITLGHTEGAMGSNGTGAPGVSNGHAGGMDGSSNYTDSTALATSPGNHFMDASSSMGDSNWVAMYDSADMSGLTFAVSYQPESELDATDVISAAVNFSTEMDAATVAVSVGTEHAMHSNLAGGAGDDTIDLYEAGIQVGMGAVTVGAGYGAMDYKTTATAKVDNWTAHVGATYTTGQHTVGLQYLTSEHETGTTTAAIEGDSWNLGYAMDLGSGVAWDIGYTDINIDGKTDTADADYSVIDTGIAISF